MKLLKLWQICHNSLTMFPVKNSRQCYELYLLLLKLLLSTERSSVFCYSMKLWLRGLGQVHKLKAIWGLTNKYYWKWPWTKFRLWWSCAFVSASWKWCFFNLPLLQIIMCQKHKFVEYFSDFPCDFRDSSYTTCWMSIQLTSFHRYLQISQHACEFTLFIFIWHS